MTYGKGGSRSRLLLILGLLMLGHLFINPIQYNLPIHYFYFMKHRTTFYDRFFERHVEAKCAMIFSKFGYSYSL